MERQEIDQRASWNHLLSDLPHAHLLQSWEWGAFKEKYGWRARRYAWVNSRSETLAAAQVLERRARLPLLPSPLAVLYCPRGPALDWSQVALRREVLSDLSAMATRKGILFLKIDPDLPIGFGVPGEEQAREHPLGKSVQQDLEQAGWRDSSEQIQFRNTLTLDLQRPEDEIMADMQQKTRYNVRLAGRRGVTVRRGEVGDLDLLYQMYAETSVRNGFVIRKPEYYQQAWGSFVQAGLACPFIAQVEDEPVAALIAYRFAERALYMYGMSRERHRDKMPNYLLQWEAIRWAKEMGCSIYDFWGAPDRLDPSDPMWGVYRFKTGFGAQLVRTLGAWDAVHRESLYALYTTVLPKFLALLRLRGRAQTREELA